MACITSSIDLLYLIKTSWCRWIISIKENLILHKYLKTDIHKNLKTGTRDPTGTLAGPLKNRKTGIRDPSGTIKKRKTRTWDPSGTLARPYKNRKTGPRTLLGP